MAEVDSFEIELAEQIKNLQQIVLKNTIDLDDDIRSIVFSRFQSIKYKRLSAEQFRNKMNVSGALAFYSPNDNTIYIQSKDNVKIDDVALLHEILHALSSTPYDRKVLTNNHSGFKSLSVEKTDNGFLWSSQLRGVNEAATEFFAERFFGSGNTLLYPFEVHIFSLLCDECDYKELKNAYFSNDVKGFKETIKKNE